MKMYRAKNDTASWRRYNYIASSADYEIIICPYHTISLAIATESEVRAHDKRDCNRYTFLNGKFRIKTSMAPTKRFPRSVIFDRQITL